MNLGGDGIGEDDEDEMEDEFDEEDDIEEAPEKNSVSFFEWLWIRHVTFRFDSC